MPSPISHLGQHIHTLRPGHSPTFQLWIPTTCWPIPLELYGQFLNLKRFRTTESLKVSPTTLLYRWGNWGTKQTNKQKTEKQNLALFLISPFLKAPCITQKCGVIFYSALSFTAHSQSKNFHCILKSLCLLSGILVPFCFLLPNTD